MELSLCDNDVKRLVETAINKAVLEALGADKDALIGKLIGQALSMKKGVYEKETIFQSEVHKMIREAAQESFKEWLDQNKESVKAEIRKQVAGRSKKDNQAFVTGIAERLVQGMTNSFYVTCNLKVED